METKRPKARRFGTCWCGGKLTSLCSGRPFLRALRCKKSGSLSLLSLLSGLVWV